MSSNPNALFADEILDEFTLLPAYQQAPTDFVPDPSKPQYGEWVFGYINNRTQAWMMKFADMLQGAKQIDFANSNEVLDPAVTYTGPGMVATRINNGGYVSFPTNNYALQTESFASSNWARGICSIVQNSFEAPDGTTSASKHIPDTTTGPHYTLGSTASFPAGSIGILSLYVKAAGYNFFSLSLQGNAYCVWDLTTGIPTQVGGAALNRGAINMGNGWWRLWVEGVIGTNIYLSSCAINNVGGFTGDGVSGGYMWHPQLEVTTRANAPTGYHPTTTAAYVGARYGYDPITKAPMGQLIEEPRTNSALNSAAFDNASWTKYNATVTADATVSPSGMNDADKIVEDTSTAASHGVGISGVAFTANSYTYSVWAKPAGRNWLLMQIGPWTSAYFNLSTGVLGTVAGTTGIANIQAFPNGWYRCSITVTATATTQNCYIFPAFANGQYPYDGDGVSGVYLWGAQLEIGAFATSYIPTTTASVARTGDRSVYNSPSFLVSTGSTFYTEYTAMQTTGAFSTYNANAGSGANCVWGLVSGPNPDFIIFSGGSAVLDYGTSGAPAGTLVKVAWAYGPGATLNDPALTAGVSVNGRAANQRTFSAMPIGTLNTLRIGTDQNGNTYLNGWLKKFTYFNQRYPDAYLPTLTA